MSVYGHAGTLCVRAKSQVEVEWERVARPGNMYTGTSVALHSERRVRLRWYGKEWPGPRVGLRWNGKE